MVGTKAKGLTIILVTHQRQMLLKRVLNTLLHSVAKTNLPVQLRILINGTDPESWNLCHQMSAELAPLKPQFKLLQSGVTPGEARNILATQVETEWILFLDDDVQVPEDMILNFQRLNQSFPSISVWGGPNLTPESSDYSANLNGWFVQNFLIVGPVSGRYRKVGFNKAKGGQFNLMLCNLFVQTAVFEENNFATHLKTAEENDLIYRIKEKKGDLGYSDQLFVWHERRAGIKKFFKQIFYYGYGRGQLLVSGSMNGQVIFGLIPLLFLSMILALVAWPVTVSILLLTWLSTVQFSHAIYFRKIDLKVFFIPVVVWILYILGIFKGTWTSLRGAFREAILQR